MRQPFIQQALGFLLLVCNDPNDPSCAGPMPFNRAIGSMLTGLPVLARAVQEKGLYSPSVVGALTTYGGLALASLREHMSPGGTEVEHIDAVRYISSRLLDSCPSTAALVQKDWLSLDPSAAPYHQLVNAIIATRTALLGTAGGPPVAVNVAMFEVLEVVLAWMWHIALETGEEEPLAPEAPVSTSA